MSKVYQVVYNYTETFCHPNELNWEKRRVAVYSTLDRDLAEKALNEWNNGKPYWHDKFAQLEIFDLDVMEK